MARLKSCGTVGKCWWLKGGGAVVRWGGGGRNVVFNLVVVDCCCLLFVARFSNFNWDDLERRKIKAPALGIPVLRKGEVCLDPSMDYEDTPVVPYDKNSDWCKDF